MNFLICTPANAVVDAFAETESETETEIETEVSEKPMPRESQAAAFLVRRISFSWALPNIYRWRKHRRGPPAFVVVWLLLHLQKFAEPQRKYLKLIFSNFFFVFPFCCCFSNVCLACC